MLLPVWPLTPDTSIGGSIAGHAGTAERQDAYLVAKQHELQCLSQCLKIYFFRAPLLGFFSMDGSPPTAFLVVRLIEASLGPSACGDKGASVLHPVVIANSDSKAIVFHIVKFAF